MKRSISSKARRNVGSSRTSSADQAEVRQPARLGHAQPEVSSILLLRRRPRAGAATASAGILRSGSRRQADSGRPTSAQQGERDRGRPHARPRRNWSGWRCEREWAWAGFRCVSRMVKCMSRRSSRRMSSPPTLKALEHHQTECLAMTQETRLMQHTTTPSRPPRSATACAPAATGIPTGIPSRRSTRTGPRNSSPWASRRWCRACSTPRPSNSSRSPSTRRAPTCTARACAATSARRSNSVRRRKRSPPCCSASACWASTR